MIDSLNSFPRVLRIFGLLLLVAQGMLTLSCGTEPEPGPSKVCSAGSTQACACTEGGSGVQTCDANGGAWGSCNGCPTFECRVNATKQCPCAGADAGTQTCGESRTWGQCMGCPPACGSLDSACDSANQCCSQICGKAKCQSATCKAGGASCSADWECCYSVCGTGTCRKNNCAAENRSCASKSDCCGSMYCSSFYGNICLACKGVGGGCSYDDMCCSHRCNSFGKCD